MRPIKKWIGLVVRALITVTICGVIVWRADFEQIYSVLKECNPLLILAVFVGMTLNVSISAYKWKLILATHGIEYKYLQLNRFYFTSVFFNNFLPTSIGGDAYRIYRTLTPNRAGAVAAVFVERFTGFWVLVILGFIGVLWQYNTGQPRPEWIGPVLLVLAAGSVLPVLIFAGSKYIESSLKSRFKIPEKFQNLVKLYKDYRQYPLKIVKIILISFGFHLFTVGWMFVLSNAVGSPVGLDKLVMGISISNIIALLPISINGIGLLDGTFIFTMTEFGMPYNAALMMMILIRALLIPLSLIGGLFYLKDRREVDLSKLKMKKA